MLLLGLCGCGSSKPITVEDSAPADKAWTALSLEISGSSAGRKEVRSCIEESRKAGVRLTAGAQLKASLTLSPDGNSISFAQKTFAIDQRQSATVCRLALAKAVSLEQKVTLGKSEPASSCRAIGTVAGVDRGVDDASGSTEAGVVAAQFAAAQHGANYLLVEPAETFSADGDFGPVSVRIKGRAFYCGDAKP